MSLKPVGGTIVLRDVHRHQRMTNKNDIRISLFLLLCESLRLKHLASATIVGGMKTSEHKELLQASACSCQTHIRFAKPALYGATFPGCARLALFRKLAS